MVWRLFALTCLLVVAEAGCTTKRLVRNFDYPPARRADVVDSYHGTQVADPYRWLERPDSKEVKDWVKAQNQLTSGFLRTPQREKIKARLTEIWNYPRIRLPFKKGTRVFFTRNDGLQNQAVLYVQESPDTEPRALLDPNRLSSDGTVALSGEVASEDGKLLAYLLSGKGSDWQEIRVRKVDTGKDFPEVLRWCKYTSIAWKHDGSGFFYNRFPDPGTVPPEDRHAYSRVYFHRPGRPQAEDEMVYERPDDKDLIFTPTITPDGKYLVLEVSRGTDPRKRIYYREVEGKGPVIRLLDEGDAAYHFLGNQGSLFYFRTDQGAPRGRIVAIDVDRPDKNSFKEIVPHQEDVLTLAAFAGHHLVVGYIQDAHQLLKVFDMQGKEIRQIELPGIGTVDELSGALNDTEMFFGFMSFLQPYTVLRYDFTRSDVTPFHRPRIDFDLAGYQTSQVFFASRDGTRVPMFLTHRKGLKLDGTNPTILYGYGGFGIGLTPRFSAGMLVWLEMGGIYASANLRGGNEYGTEWHRAGVLGNKQNVFDDFIAAAEWLVARRYTHTGRLAIMGGSNGGLLTAACMLQRPELFGAVISRVPVLDMLRYHKFTSGRYWAFDYGNAEKDPEHFSFLYAYSPLHNIKPGTAYPPTLVTTADTDDRVVPMHAKKFVAALQHGDAGRNPILLRVETRAGHGRGKPIKKKIDESADLFAFLSKVLGLDPEG